MVAALKHMHTEHIVHCDLKVGSVVVVFVMVVVVFGWACWLTLLADLWQPENVLCTHDPSAGSDDWDIKITDFGLSKVGCGVQYFDAEWWWLCAACGGGRPLGADILWQPAVSGVP